MITAGLFVIAAAAGALARAEAGRRWNRHDQLALGTIVVNVTGSFLLGLLADVTPPAFTVLGVAGLGAYTTFSSLARDAVALIERRQAALAVAYLAVTLALGTVASALGVAISG